MSNVAISTKDYLKHNLENKLPELTEILNSEKKAKQFIANYISLLADKNINKCEKSTLFVTAWHIAQLRLAPQQALGQAYVVPRKNKDGVQEATLQIGYKGWQVIAERAGKRVHSKIVYKCDTFEEVADEKGITIHYKANPEKHPEDNAGIWKELVGVIVWVTDNGVTVPEFVPHRVIKKRFEASKKAMYGKESPAWKEWTEEMIIAKAVKYVLTKLPLDVMEERNEQMAIAVTAEADELQQEQTALAIDDIATPLEVNPETGEVLDAIPTEEEMAELKQQLQEQEEQETLV